MAYGRISAPQRGTWMQEQTALIKESSPSELAALNDEFDSRLETTIGTLKSVYDVDVKRDYKRMLENPEIMKEYKTELLDPIVKEFKEYECSTDAEHEHLVHVAEQLEEAWDSGVKSFIQESYNVANYLPLSTLDFPALVKQYIRFLGKDIIPVQTASSVNIEQRIFTKYLVNNQTGEEYEVPRVYFQREADGTRTWKKLWNAGKGYRINNKKAVTLEEIANAPGKKFSVFTHLLDDNGNELDITAQKTVRTRLSYDFHINFVDVTTPASTTWTAVTITGTGTTEDPYVPAFEANKYYANEGDTTAIASAEGWGTTVTTVYTKTETAASSKKVRLPGSGINIDIQTGGVFLNGGITADMNLPVVDPTKNDTPTGEVVNFDDHLSGVVDFIRGTVTASACGNITGIYISGHVSNETNMRTIGFREYPSIRKFLIADGVRFQLPFTVEDFAEAQASLNFNLYNRLVQELVTHQEMFEDESILEFLDTDFDANSGFEQDIWSLQSYTYTETVDLDPTAISPNFAGDPWEYRTNAIQNAITTVIYELCDRGKMDNLGFVIYANPKCTRLLSKFTTWTVQKSTSIGGVQMNHAFGILTDFDVPIRVVASNRVDAYTLIDAYQEGHNEGDKSREYFFKIVAYPMDKFHITYKHLRFARHLTNSPENAAYADAQNPGGAAVYVTTSSQYQTISIQGIQGRVICKNSVLVPDSLAGLVETTSVTTGTGDLDNNVDNGNG